MLGSVKIGRIFGFPVDLHVTFLVLLGLAAVFGGLQTAGLLLLVFASVLVHELGHALVSRGMGVPILGITLLPFGGMARMERQPAPRQELLIALAGPATSLLIGAFATMAWIMTDVMILGTLASINLVLGVFNLLPALPMDGGRVLRSALVGPLGQLKATVVAGRLARLLAVGLAISAFWIGPMVLVIAFLVWWMAGQEMRHARAVAMAEQVRRAQEQGVPFSGAPFGGPVGAAAFSNLVEELRARTGQRPGPSARGDGRSDVPASRMVVDVPPGKS